MPQQSMSTWMPLAGSSTIRWMEKHVAHALALALVDGDAVRARGFKVAVDAVSQRWNHFADAVGSPRLRSGRILRSDRPVCPQPRAASRALDGPREAVVKEGATSESVWIDVDRLAFVGEDGSWFGEEYTLVAVADYVLSKTLAIP